MRGRTGWQSWGGTPSPTPSTPHSSVSGGRLSGGRQMGQGQGHTSDNLVHGHSRAGAAQQGRTPGGTGGTAADREAGWGSETDAAVRTAWEAGRQGAAEEKGAYDREAATTPASPVATGWQGNPCSGPCRALPASSYAPPPLPRTACWALPAAESVPCVAGGTCEPEH